MRNDSRNLYSRSRYHLENDPRSFCDITDVLLKKESNNIIDSSSVLSIIKKSYIIGDATILKGVTKSPWMHQYLDNDNRFEKLDLPKHGELNLEKKEIAIRFKDLLLKEARKYISGKSVVGILLSGGMDSRIVAGVIRELQERNEFSGTVVGLTWGLENTRDVVYAREVIKKYKWDHVHYPLTAEILAENISLAASLGAEVSPLHLHAMPSVAEEKGIDCILAGSYGDSVGRGEFSGKKLEQLTGQLAFDYNKFGFLTSSFSNKHNKKLELQLANYQENFPRDTLWQQYEVEQQCHYMRRQLGSCMDIIDNKIPVYQMFTLPEVFGFIWSLTPECRDNYVYEELLKILPGQLLDIPWARDGKIYPSKGKVLDNIPSSHNKYGEWLRNDCYDLVNQYLNNDSLERLNIFNPKALNFWKSYWHRCDAKKADKLDERISWLAALSIFCENNSVVGEETMVDSRILLNYEASKGFIYGLAYRKARKIIGK